MKPIAAVAILGAAIMMGCDSQVKTSQADMVLEKTAETRVAEIAGDKTLTADLMRRSHERGTFDDALALAMQDSAFAMEVLEAVKRDARLAAMLAPETKGTLAVAKTGTTTSKKSGARTVASRTTTSRSSGGDVLDKTERTVQDANKKIDQAVRIKDQMEEARRKAEGIFRSR